MKINVYAFAVGGDVFDVQMFASEQNLMTRMIREMGGTANCGESSCLATVTEVFRNWMLSKDCPPGRHYKWQVAEFEIPVEVVVGMEGGVFRGASATAAGISILPFDWDDECEAVGERAAMEKFDELTRDMEPIA